jgi:hypothetical protein
MKNPNPIVRARRIEMRRKQLGCPSRCFYCPETDLFCFEEDHPVTRQLDERFKRVVCRNCHRKLEINRDNKGLTKNGLRRVRESECEKARRYDLLLAEDLDSIADVVQSPHASPALIAAALKNAASSLRRTAPKLPLPPPPDGNRVEVKK